MSAGGRPGAPSARPVGFLPALGGGLGALAETGQLPRLVDGYLRPYAAAFGRVEYFSYRAESLADFGLDGELGACVGVHAPARATPRGARAVRMVGAHPEAFRACRALRVFQLTGVVPALMARRRFGTPYATTYGFWYGALSRGGPRRLLKAALERVGLRRAAAVIATTEALRARAARWAPRVELVPNGVDVSRFAPAAAPPPAAPPRVLYVGRFSPEKNLATLVEAVARCRARARLVLVGAGPERESLVARARQAGVELELPGVVDQRALPAVYAGAHAFVLPSFTEGHPKALLEAQAAALPCVVSDCDGNRSLVADGATGLIFDPRRADELAAALDRVLGDAALAAALGARARAQTVARYDLRALVAREIALVREIAGS